MLLVACATIATIARSTPPGTGLSAIPAARAPHPRDTPTAGAHRSPRFNVRVNTSRGFNNVVIGVESDGNACHWYDARTIVDPDGSGRGDLATEVAIGLRSRLEKTIERFAELKYTGDNFGQTGIILDDGTHKIYLPQERLSDPRFRVVRETVDAFLHALPRGEQTRVRFTMSCTK